MKDSQIKEKMESLDALSGGVVFGKEEAWERLQERMDKKPALLFRFRYAAVAALLLVLISIGVIRYDSQEKIADNLPLNNTTTPIVSEQGTAVYNTTDSQPRVITMPTPMESEPALFVQHEPLLDKLPQGVVVPMPVAQLQLPQINPTVAEVNIELHPKLNLKNMRVVHINDLNAGYTPEQEDMYVYDGPKLDISKMKVVSIYDIQQEGQTSVYEEGMLTMMRINRPHGNTFVFQNPFRRNYGTSGRLYARSPLNINFNRNN